MSGIQWTHARLWCAGMRCAMSLLSPPWTRWSLRFGVRMLLCPVDLMRYCELPPVLDQMPDDGVVVDISSPRLVPWLIARRRSVLVLAGDLARRAALEAQLYTRGSFRGRMVPIVYDARYLPLPDGLVDYVTAVSSIEHIPGPGDSGAMREIGRVLRKGGRAVVSVPVGPIDRDHFTKCDPYGSQPREMGRGVFFGHEYTVESVQTRLIGASGLHIERILLFDETTPGWYEKSYLPRVSRSFSLSALFTKPLDPFLAARRLGPALNNKVSGRGLAVMVLVKPGGPA